MLSKARVKRHLEAIACVPASPQPNPAYEWWVAMDGGAFLIWSETVFHMPLSRAQGLEQVMGSGLCEFWLESHLSWNTNLNSSEKSWYLFFPHQVSLGNWVGPHLRFLSTAHRSVEVAKIQYSRVWGSYCQFNTLCENWGQRSPVSWYTNLPLRI